MTEYKSVLDEIDTDYVHLYFELHYGDNSTWQYVCTIHRDHFGDFARTPMTHLVATEEEATLELTGEMVWDDDTDDDPDAGEDPRTEALTIGERNPGLAQEYRR